MTTPDFPDLLTLIDKRSGALAVAAATAADDAPVPSCPDWTVRDLVGHLGEVQRFWAAIVAAGPADGPTAGPPAGMAAAIPDGDLTAWYAESTGLLLAALEEGGPDAGCWTWWAASPAPSTAGAVARHQVQEAAVHARDAQEAAGRAEPIPAGIALDGVGEFLVVGFGSCGAWPDKPARVAVHADEGGSWVIDLTEAGAAVVDGGAGPEPDASLRGPASDLVLALYGRRPLDAVGVDGDRAVVERLLVWPPFD